MALAVAGMPVAGQVPDAALPPRIEDFGPRAPRFRDFPLDLGRNFAALASSDNLKPVIIGTVATTSAIPADSSVRRYFAKPERLDGFGAVGKQLGKSQLMGPVIALSLLGSRISGNSKHQRLTYDLAQGFVVNAVLTGGVKAATQRPRPDGADKYSFPSGHTSNAYMWAAVVSRHYGRKAAIPAYAAAAYVGASRLHSRKHNLTDIVAGATLGYIVGRTVTRRSAANSAKPLVFNVTIPPGGGAAVGLSIRMP